MRCQCMPPLNALLNGENIKIDCRQCKKISVEPVKKTAMAGDQAATVLDPDPTFQG